MRYLVALIIGIGVLFGINFFADLFSMPRPWGSLLMGATVGITMVLVLLIWEVVKPSHKDAVPAKPAQSEEERANARAERRSRLAAEAGVSLDDSSTSGSKSEVSSSGSKSEVSSTEPRVPPIPPAANESEENKSEVSPDPDESSMEAESNDTATNDTEHNDTDDHLSAETNDAASKDSEVGRSDDADDFTVDESAVNESETLDPDEFDEEATGSSLENPPTGEPGVSVDALEDSESAQADEPEGVDAPDDTDSPSANGGTSKY